MVVLISKQSTLISGIFSKAAAFFGYYLFPRVSILGDIRLLFLRNSVLAARSVQTPQHFAETNVGLGIFTK